MRLRTRVFQSINRSKRIYTAPSVTSESEAHGGTRQGRLFTFTVKPWLQLQESHGERYRLDHAIVVKLCQPYTQFPHNVRLYDNTGR